MVIFFLTFFPLRKLMGDVNKEIQLYSKGDTLNMPVVPICEPTMFMDM